ncbi:adenylate kinase 9-like [Lingula anatina]|uniref:Adenylate kinase 9-like n=1 Tax=Lingula anatina TaxID=7574 RepID=A0A1S3IN58_LINAN|nr:adenylate kinase 9-like [Lingula anatina]|eukprot:XP_013399518.1 adenylate kinase 9-like [Lingula anatina]
MAAGMEDMDLFTQELMKGIMDKATDHHDEAAKIKTAVNVTESRSQTSITLAEQLEERLKKLDTDPFDEDEAELRFLHSKPTCFVLIGKPGAGKTALGRRLAAEWKCEFVHATDIIMQAIEMQTERGNIVSEILLRGEAIPEEIVAKMIEEKINSMEVAHHGYILDGFPSLSEEYMSLKDQLELVRNWKMKPDFIINLKMPDKDLERRRLGQRVDPVTGEIYTQEMYAPDKPKEVQFIDKASLFNNKKEMYI